MDGKINLCPKGNCNFHCCEFNQNNYIVLFPNELEYARDKQMSLEHLDIIGSIDERSFKAICKAKDREHCDFGYKPVDCMIYPIFPNGEPDFLLKGRKCPLSNSELAAHVHKCNKLLDHLPFIERHELGQWFKKVKLVGYTSVCLAELQL